MTREDELLAIFRDPDGVIDDSEELLEEIPDWLSQIVEARKLAHVVDRYCQDAISTDRPTKEMCSALKAFEETQ